MALPRGLAAFNRRVTNHVTRPFAGRLPGFGIVVHRGRRSGREYRSPVNAFATTGGYVAFWWIVAILLFALPFLVGWAVAKLSGKTLAIVGAILAAFFIAILIMGQLFVF